ncbi:MAG: GNAT family N-acetyltransferase [Bacteroidales bacterium]|nr:GNAT family N-acetyltransferase [Bacteroidales bacterium]
MLTFSKITDLACLDEIFAVYSAAIAAMEDGEIFQWDDVYPDKEILAEDIAKNQMFVGLIDNHIAVCFVLSEECDSQYQNGKWTYPDAKFNVIHRLCVNPKFQKKGIAMQTLEFIENLCKSDGYETIRIDCFTENPHAKKLYDKAGYIVTGYANWRKGKFELREKKL